MIKTRYFMMLLVILGLLSSCAKSEDVFGDVGQNIAGPTAMTVDVASNRLYLVNSNSRDAYDWHQGNFQVLDISNPLAPSIVKSVTTDSYSGTIYLDTTTKKAYIPNRLSLTYDTFEDKIYEFSVDESSADFLTPQSSPAGRDAYDIACCYPARRAWVTTSDNQIQYIDLDVALAPAGNLSLLTTLSTGTIVSGSEVYHIAISGNQAFLSREGVGVMIVNLDKVGVSGTVPTDYFIEDVGDPRGIAIRGSYLYVVGEGVENDTWTKYLLVLDVSTLVPLTGNTYTESVDKNDANILVALIELGSNPRGLLLSTAYAFVANYDDDTVSVIDLATNQKISDIAVGEDPFGMALYTDLTGVDKYLYVGNTTSNTISIIDIPTLSVVATYQ